MNQDNNSDHNSLFGNFRSQEDWLNDPTNPIIYCKLLLDGKEFLTESSYEVELHQKTNKHDRFSITVSADAIDEFKGFVMNNSRYLNSKEILIKYHQYGKIRQTFFGIIEEIVDKRNESGYGDMIIKGKSPSLYLKGGKKCRSFENKTLEQIVKEVTAGYPQEAQVEISSNYLNDPNKKALPYTVQYKESDYQFLQRLAKRHGEFFYYDGEKLKFGNDVKPVVKIEEGIDLYGVTFKMKLGAQDFSFIGYDALSGTTIEKDSSSIIGEFKEGPFQNIAANISKKVFPQKDKMYFGHTGIQPFSESELKEAVRLEKERRENLFSVKGKTRNPDVRIGGRVEMTDINNHAMETYRIIEIKHCFEPGDYWNEFVAVLDLFNAAHYIDTDAVPKGEEQPARVIDNNDPDGTGRIRVQFPWQEAKNEKTPWIRLIQPHSGSGKGFHFIPEIGEEVMVAFEGGNAEKPYVLGTHYNGSETSSYHTSGNDKKVIHTRSGTKIILNDAEGSVFIEDPSGNTYLMDGAGNINVNAPKNMTFTAGENLNINVGMNMTTTVGMNKSNSVGMNITETAGANIWQNATLDYSLNATNITKTAMENYNYHANDIYKNAAENIGVAAGKDYTQNSEGTVHNLSAENGHNA